MKRLGGGLVALLTGGDGDGTGLLLRKDSGVVARSSSVLSRSIVEKKNKTIFCYNSIGQLSFGPKSLVS